MKTFNEWVTLVTENKVAAQDIATRFLDDVEEVMDGNERLDPEQKKKVATLYTNARRELDKLTGTVDEPTLKMVANNMLQTMKQLDAINVRTGWDADTRLN